MQKILLHTCCAPCSASTISLLQEQYDIVSFWYNPNIYPLQEYELRKKAWQEYMQFLKIRITEKNAQWLSNDELYESVWLDKAVRCDKGRCYFCYEKRLEETSVRAKELGISNFSTTLLASPYQKHEEIKQIAQNIAELNGLNFVYIDPRKIFYTGVNQIKKMGLYSQKYCGCKLSIRK
jgi:hypothetical protein